MLKCIKCWAQGEIMFKDINNLFCSECLIDKTVNNQDMVNHPNHYTRWNIEVIDFILDQKLGYLESNIVKYICRYKYKNWVEDLEKAKFYLDKLIKDYENQL